MKVLAICGSLQRRSSNLTLLQAAQNAAPVGVEVNLFDGVARLPHFDPDLEADEPLQVVEEWRVALRSSDAVLIATPEYGHSLPGALKNAIDWVIGSGELYQKPVAITAAVPTSERGRRGLAALRQVLEAVDARIVNDEPIVRGELFERDVAALLNALIERARPR
ncbi:MAG TPA: NAD(P)H-dependent oxidoreductase [Polyangiaceae bacterium]|nr:NAD(P)H-dependent oxidoreductase [Polyangiaceae bacterium]